MRVERFKSEKLFPFSILTDQNENIFFQTPMLENDQLFCILSGLRMNPAF